MKNTGQTCRKLTIGNIILRIAAINNTKEALRKDLSEFIYDVENKKDDEGNILVHAQHKEDMASKSVMHNPGIAESDKAVGELNKEINDIDKQLLLLKCTHDYAANSLPLTKEKKDQLLMECKKCL